MKYQQLLEETKKFLEETHVSKWCSQCKGACCGFNCMSITDCHNRLACKIYLCSDMQTYLFGMDFRKYSDIMYYVGNTIRKCHGNRNEWFTPYNSYLDQLEFDNERVKLLFLIDRNNITKKIDVLIKNPHVDECLYYKMKHRNEELNNDSSPSPHRNP